MNFSDPFGLCAQDGEDIYYDACGNVTRREANDLDRDRYFLQVGSGTYQLDYGLEAGDTPYAIFVRV